MAPNDLSKAEENFIRFVKACVDLIKLPLIDILTDQIKPEDLYNKINSCTKLCTGKYKLLQLQKTLCYLPPPDVPDYKSFDVTLLYKLIINLCPSLQPTQGWFKVPLPTDTSTGADIERLRLLKNSYSHDDSTEFPDIEFQKVWKDLKCVIQRCQKKKWRKYDYEDELEKIERIKFGYEDRDTNKLNLKTILKLWEEVKQRDEPEIMIKGENEVLFGNTARFDAVTKQTETSNRPVTWQRKKGDEIKILKASDEKYKDSTNRRLFILSVCKDDEAEYQAVVSTGNKSSITSNSIHLQAIGDLPFFNVWDIKTDKEELTINYEYKVTQSSPQVFEVKWAKNGEPLNWENNRYLGGRSLDDKYLTITSPTTDGKGTYSCTVTNAVGSVSKDVKFDVPNATISTDNSEVVFRSETKVNSLVASCPKPDGVEWQKSKDGKNFCRIDINEPHYHGSSLNPESPLLLISNTMFEDMLYYRLRVWNKIGEHFSDALYFDVKGSPPNITSSHETDIKTRSVKLIGKVFLYDQSHEILDVYWSVGEKKIDTIEGGKKYSIVSIKEPSLTIFNVNEYDAGSYQLTATNAVGETKSHVIVLDTPQISFERRENTDKSLIFSAMIQSIPAAYHAQWKVKEKYDDIFTPVKSNAEDYLEISNSLPHPVLVIKRRELLENKCFLIEVNNFVGKSVKEILCNEVSETSNKTEGDFLSDIFNTKGLKIRFNNLRLKLIESLAEKDLQSLKETLEVLSPIGKEFRDVNSISDFISRLWGKGVIKERNVIIMQYLMRSLKRMDLEQMFVKYAIKDKQALCFYEDPLNQDGSKFCLHVADGIENFTTMEALLQTVADIVDCEPTDIQVVALQPENSFIIIMTMREDLISKLKETNPPKLRKLLLFKVDWIRIEDKVINIVEADEMDDVDQNSPNVSNSNTNINPRDLISLGLLQELDTDQGLFHEFCQRAAQDLGPVFKQSVSNAHEFFEALENNLSNDEVLVLDYLIALVDLVNLHSHQGSQHFKNVLLEYKRKLTKYREDCARISQSKAEEFIGRTNDLKDIVEKLIGKKYQGVAICGLGGMGKSSLAEEVCYRLQHAREIWHIKYIDMREKEDLIDLLRDMVGEMGLDCNSTELNDLYSELCNGLKGMKTRTIFFMDNLDDMMKTTEKKDRLLYFLDAFCKVIKSMGTEVRILVTLRQKLVSEETLRCSASQTISRSSDRLHNGLLFELELSKLKLQDGVNLFKACCGRQFTPASDNQVCRKVVKLCGGSPLAIKSVGAAIRSGKVNPEMLAKKLEDLPDLDIESRCLAQTFETLDQSKKHLLIKLHVFGTAKFDLAFAAFVLGEKSIDEEKPIVFETSLNMIYLKSRLFVEVDDLQKGETDDIKTTSKSAKFSLNPLVHKFLLKIADQVEFEKPVNEAKSLFVVYVEKKNNRIFEYFEKNCVKAWKELKDFKVHLKIYYQLIQKSSSEFWNKGSRTVLTCKRVSEVADLFLEDTHKFRLLNKCIRLSKGGGKFLETALWQIHLGKKYFEIDRIEKAGEVLNCVLNNTLLNIPSDFDDLGQLVEVAVAAFYLAGNLCIQDRKYVEALHYLEDAKHLWNKMQGKAVKKKYKTDLALVYNSLGKVYANMTPQNLKKSKYNHLKAFLIVYRISDNFNHIDIPLYVQNIGRCLYREGLEFEKLYKKKQANQSFRDAETYFRYAMKLLVHFKMEKFDIYVEVLKSLAYVEMKLGEMGLAEESILKCYELRKIMCQPNEAITLAIHDVATVRIERAIYLYWDYFKNNRGDKYASINKLYEAIADYENLMHPTKIGGLPRNHPEYPSMKRAHIWALTQVKETKKIEKALQFYKDFESGKFEENRKHKRSKEETTRFFYTCDELQTMPAAGAFEGATLSACSSSESSSDSDDNVPESPKPPLVIDTHTTNDLVLRKTKLNFNYVFRQCQAKKKARYGDSSSDDYFIEENFEGVNILDNFNAFENVIEKAQKMECDSYDDEIDELVGQLVSSQSSVEEDEPKGKKRRFKGPCKSSLQKYQEDTLTKSKNVTKGSCSSSSSTEVSMTEFSMNEDKAFVEVERNPVLVSLKRFIYDRLRRETNRI